MIVSIPLVSFPTKGMKNTILAIINRAEGILLTPFNSLYLLKERIPIDNTVIKIIKLMTPTPIKRVICLCIINWVVFTPDSSVGELLAIPVYLLHKTRLAMLVKLPPNTPVIPEYSVKVRVSIIFLSVFNVVRFRPQEQSRAFSSITIN